MKTPDSVGQQKRELNAEEHKIATSLESFQHLEPKDRVFLVLVWKGLKTATAVSLELGMPESVLRDLKERVEKAGMLFNEGPVLNIRIRGSRPGKICLVANNQKDLDLISHFWSRPDYGNHERDPEIYWEMGRMSGLPQTAIEAYDKIYPKTVGAYRDRIKPQVLMVSEDEKIERLKDEPDLIPFATLFYMSRVNFNSEIEIVRKWAEEIKKITPALYRLFINDFIKYRDRI